MLDCALYVHYWLTNVSDLCKTGCVFSVTRVNVSVDCPFEKLSAHAFITTTLSTIDNRSFLFYQVLIYFKFLLYLNSSCI